MTNTLSRHMRDRRGLNLIELAIVMAVVGLIVGGIYIAASSVYRNVRESSTQDDMLQIVQNMRSTYGVQGLVPSGALANTNLINAGIIPADMIQGTALTNAFGGTSSLTGITGPPAAFTITISNIPGSVCSDLAIKTTSSGQAGATNIGLINIAMNGGAAVANSAFPITPDSSQSNCGTGVGSVAFTYTIR